MVDLIQPSFAAGELGPALYGRVDISKYAVGLRTTRNVFIKPHGGVVNRAGLEFIGPVKDHTKRARLIPFQFNTTQTYILEFGDKSLRVLKDAGQVLEADKTITGATAANPVVVTSAAHGFSNGDQVYISGVGGMTELNGRWFKVANVAANTFELQDQVTGANVNGTGFTAYTSGGTAARVYTVTSPYDYADLPQLKHVQSADTMTLTHRGYDVRELTRTAHASWAFSSVTFEPSIDAPTGLTATAKTAGTEAYRYRVTAIKRDTLEESLPAINASSYNITGATQANPVVVTAGGHGFDNGDVIYITGISGMTELNGRRFTVANVAANTFELQGENGTSYTAYSSGGTAARTHVILTSATISSTDYIDVSVNAVSGAERYDFYREKNGAYGFVGQSTSPTFRDTNINPDTGDAPPNYRNPFFGTGNKPGAVSYYEQRRVFGGSTNKPDTSWYSQTGNMKNMSVSSPSRDDDAITATLNARQVNEIRHFVPLNDLIVLTSGGEWKVNSGQDSAFAATTIKQRPQSYWGASHVPPIVVGNTVLFVQERGSIIRNVGYQLESDAYDGTDLTILANHLFEDKTVVEWAYSQIPHSIIWCVMSDGTALSLTYNKEQQVIAWARHETEGEFESVACIPEDEDNEDAVYFIVKREIDGQTVRYIERMRSRYFTEVEDCFFVDSGLTLDSPVTITGATAANPVVITATAHGFSNGDEVDIVEVEGMTELNGRRFTVANAAANTFELSGVNGTAYTAYVSGGEARKAVLTIGGLRHLEGASVVALADGNVKTGLTVTDGEVTLPRKASRVHVGLAYTSDVETLNVEVGQPTIQGKLKKISSVTVRFLRSRGLFVGPTFDDLLEMKWRENEVMGAATSLLTGDKAINIEPSWNSNGRVCLRQPNPLPMEVQAIIPDVTVGG